MASTPATTTTPAQAIETSEPIPRSSSNPKLPPPFDTSSSPIHLITQGAEALLYKTTFLTASQPAALKIRPSKPWRHPNLDRRLTRQRVLAEARVLIKCRREGLDVPAVLALDWERGWLVCEWIEGVTVKEAIRGWTVSSSSAAAVTGVGEGEDEDEESMQRLRGLLRRMGVAVGKLHAGGVVHGDLTTSNMMVRGRQGGQSRAAAAADRTDPAANVATGTSGVDGGEISSPAKVLDHKTSDLDGSIVLIDFGLAMQATQEEERAVDLYVLERAFGSTHPKEEGLFGEVLAAYADSYKAAKLTLKRLEDVRMRGRKKSMIG